MLICESCNYIRLSTHTESTTLQKLKKTVSRAVTFNFSLNKHKLKGKVQSIFPSDNGHTRESWALIFHLGSTTPTPSDQHLTSRVFLRAGWGSSRVPGMEAGCWMQWQMSEGEQAAAQVPLCPCCSGWHLLLSHRWPGPAALGAAGLWILSLQPCPHLEMLRISSMARSCPGRQVSAQGAMASLLPTPLCWVWNLKHFAQTHLFFIEKSSVSWCSQSSHPGNGECPSSTSTGAAGFWFGAVHLCEVLWGTRVCRLTTISKDPGCASSRGIKQDGT